MVNIMDKDEYLKLVSTKNHEKNIIKNASISFLVGGILGAMFHVLTTIIMKLGASRVMASGTSLFLFILASVTLTGIGVFDKLVSKFKFGLIIPITGFAHSVASCLLEYKKDGLITGLGANMFKLAGAVILYGSVSGITLAIIKVIIYG